MSTSTLRKAFKDYLDVADPRHRKTLGQRLDLLDSILAPDEQLLQRLLQKPEDFSSAEILQVSQRIQLVDPQNSDELAHAFCEIVLARSLELHGNGKPIFPAFSERSWLPQYVSALPILNAVETGLSKIKLNELDPREALGTLAITLVSFGGLGSYRELASIIADPCAIYQLGDSFFYDVVATDQAKKKSRTKRVFLDPLSAVILAKFHSEFAQLEGLEHRKSRAKFIRIALRKIAHSLNIESIKQLMRAQPVLSGVFGARANNSLMNNDLPLAAFLHANGVVLSQVEPEAEEDDGQDDAVAEGLAGLRRTNRVAAKYLTEAQFEEFISLLEYYPGLSGTNRNILMVIFNLAFYCGMRLREITELRCIDAHLFGRKQLLLREFEYVEQDTTHKRRLKSQSSNRHVPIDHLPATVLELIQQFKSLASGDLLLPQVGGIEQVGNRVLQRFFPRLKPTIHTLRHCFASRLMICVTIRSYELWRLHPTALPNVISDQLSSYKDHLAAYGHELDAPCPRDLHYLSKNMGHSSPDVTMYSYIHTLDLCSHLAMAFQRSKAYRQLVWRWAGVVDRTYDRHMKKLATTNEVPCLLPISTAKALERISMPLDTSPLAFDMNLVMLSDLARSIYDTSSGALIEELDKGFSSAELDFVVWFRNHFELSCLSHSDIAQLISGVDLERSYIKLPATFNYEGLAKAFQRGKYPIANIQLKKQSQITASFLPIKSLAVLRALNQACFIRLM